MIPHLARARHHGARGKGRGGREESGNEDSAEHLCSGEVCQRRRKEGQMGESSFFSMRVLCVGRVARSAASCCAPCLDYCT